MKTKDLKMKVIEYPIGLTKVECYGEDIIL